MTIGTSYSATTAFTITLASLGNSTTAGRQSTVVDNTSIGAADFHVKGHVKCGTNTSGALIEIYAFGWEDDAPVWPDVLGATDAAVTFTTRAILLQSCELLDALVCDGSSSRVNYLKPKSVASRFGGFVPGKWGVVVVNSSGGTISATGGDHAFYYEPIFVDN